MQVPSAMRPPEVADLSDEPHSAHLVRGGTAPGNITSGRPALDRYPEICSDFVHCPRSNGRGSGNLARRSSGTRRPLKEAGTIRVQVLR